jgi:SulP family sulfate permease
MPKSDSTQKPSSSLSPWLLQALPCLGWLKGYRMADLPHDIASGLFVAVLLVPQAMAYAALADLPPRVGLYATLAPALFYALFGASRFLSIGPVALVSLLVADSLGQATALHDIEPTAAAMALAAIVGLLLTIMGMLRLGFIINFISDAVIIGFTSAAALLIALSQLRHLLGLDLERGGNFFTTLIQMGQQWQAINPTTSAIGVTALLFLLIIDNFFPKWLTELGLSERWRLVITKAAPLALMATSTLVVWELALQDQVAIVGDIGGGLPPLALPPFSVDLWVSLLPGGFVISLIIFTTGMAVAQSLAGRRRQALLPNREAFALGAANLAVAFTSGYPVGASLSRSALNFDVGARTPAAALVTALLLALTVVFLGPLFYFLPKSLLAALVISAVIGLFKISAMGRVWAYSVAEGMTLTLPFAAVLVFGVQWGLLVGAGSAIALYLWRTSRPRITLQGRLKDSEAFRSAERDSVTPEVSPVLILRIDQDIYFASAGHCEQRVLSEVAVHPEINYLLLDLRSVNTIDHSGFEMLKRLQDNLKDASVVMAFAEIKRPLLDEFKRIGLLDRLEDKTIFETTHEALTTLEAHAESNFMNN